MSKLTDAEEKATVTIGCIIGGILVVLLAMHFMPEKVEAAHVAVVEEQQSTLDSHYNEVELSRFEGIVTRLVDALLLKLPKDRVANLYCLDKPVEMKYFIGQISYADLHASDADLIQLVQDRALAAYDTCYHHIDGLF